MPLSARSHVACASNHRKIYTPFPTTTTPFVSWIVLAFVGLREESEFLVCIQATDRAETCEVLAERLHQVEAEVKEIRIDSCGNFQVHCDSTCTMGVLSLLIITILTAA